MREVARSRAGWPRRASHPRPGPGGPRGDGARRAAYARGGRGLRRGILGPEGAIDRRALGAIVFARAARPARLNAIVHPRVREEEARRGAPWPARRGVRARDRRGAARRVGPAPAVRPPGRGRTARPSPARAACGSATASTRRRLGRASTRRCPSRRSGASATAGRHRGEPGRDAARAADAPRAPPGRASAAPHRPRSRCRGAGPARALVRAPRRARAEPAPPRWPGCWRSCGPDLDRSAVPPRGPAQRARGGRPSEGPWIPSDPRPARGRPLAGSPDDPARPYELARRGPIPSVWPRPLTPSRGSSSGTLPDAAAVLVALVPARSPSLGQRPAGPRARGSRGLRALRRTLGGARRRLALDRGVRVGRGPPSRCGRGRGRGGPRSQGGWPAPRRPGRRRLDSGAELDRGLGSLDDREAARASWHSSMRSNSRARGSPSAPAAIGPNRSSTKVSHSWQWGQRQSMSSAR